MSRAAQIRAWLASVGEGTSTGYCDHAGLVGKARHHAAQSLSQMARDGLAERVSGKYPVVYRLKREAMTPAAAAQCAKAGRDRRWAPLRAQKAQERAEYEAKRDAHRQAREARAQAERDARKAARQAAKDARAAAREAQRQAYLDARQAAREARIVTPRLRTARPSRALLPRIGTPKPEPVKPVLPSSDDFLRSGGVIERLAPGASSGVIGWKLRRAA